MFKIKGILEFYKIYTDESKTDNKVSCSFATLKEYTVIHHKSMRLNNEATVYTAELVATDRALIKVNRLLKYKTVSIIADFKSMSVANIQYYNSYFNDISNLILFNEILIYFGQNLASLIMEMREQVALLKKQLKKKILIYIYTLIKYSLETTLKGNVRMF